MARLSASASVSWNGPYSLLILTEVGGKIAFGDIQEGVTMRRSSTSHGLSRKVSSITPAPRIVPAFHQGRVRKDRGALYPAGRRAYLCGKEPDHVRW